jgi:hemolysin III
VNFLTHAVGLLLSIVGAAALVAAAQRRHDAGQIVGCGVYAATLVALYAASTLSHSFERPRVRHFFRMADQACIFLLIAGTYTPIGLGYRRDVWGWTLLALVWAAAVVGILFKICFSRLKNVATAFYVLMGWLPGLAIGPMTTRLPGAVLAWLVAGGLLYTIGTLFLACDNKVRFFHSVWHLFVIGGSVCHFIAVVLIIAPSPQL